MTQEKEKKLTPKQAKFVSEYLKTGNATEAARRAGYKGNASTLGSVGAENLTKPAVVRAIEEKQKKRDERMQMEEDFELKKALRLLEMCMEPEQIVDMMGNPVQDGSGNFVFKFDSRGANAALSTICKLRGKFVTKVQVGLADDLSAQLGRIDDGE